MSFQKSQLTCWTSSAFSWWGMLSCFGVFGFWLWSGLRSWLLLNRPSRPPRLITQRGAYTAPALLLCKRVAPLGRGRSPASKLSWRWRRLSQLTPLLSSTWGSMASPLFNVSTNCQKIFQLCRHISLKVLLWHHDLNIWREFEKSGNSDSTKQNIRTIATIAALGFVSPRKPVCLLHHCHGTGRVQKPGCNKKNFEKIQVFEK